MGKFTKLYQAMELHQSTVTMHESVLAERWFDDTNGIYTADDMMDMALGSVPVPAACDHGCQVEPDGVCKHGHPSVLKVLGLTEGGLICP